MSKGRVCRKKALKAQTGGSQNCRIVALCGTIKNHKTTRR